VTGYEKAHSFDHTAFCSHGRSFNVAAGEGAYMETTERAERNEKAIEFWKSHCVNVKCS